mgnify:FL=1
MDGKYETEYEFADKDTKMTKFMHNTYPHMN